MGCKFELLAMVMLLFAMGSNAKFIKLKFYFQGGAPNTTNVIVAGANNNVIIPQFGSIFVFDDVITPVANNQTTQHLGRAQGWVALTDIATGSSTYYITILYDHGGLKGQFLLLGRDLKGTGSESELAIAGGTGSFRFGSGYATWKYMPFLQFSLTAEVVATIWIPSMPKY